MPRYYSYLFTLCRREGRSNCTKLCLSSSAPWYVHSFLSTTVGADEPEANYDYDSDEFDDPYPWKD